MTAVCYDGDTIAADRMSRITTKDGTKAIKSMEQEKISIDYLTTMFDGERVRAVGRAGHLKVSLELLRLLRDSNDLYNELDSIPARLKSVLNDDVARSAALLVMTTGHVYRMRIDKHGKCRCEKYDRSKKLAIGSGCATALFLMEHTGLNAVDAVAAMELAHDCCGGGVTYTSRLIADFPEPLRIREHTDKKTVAQRLLKALLKASTVRLSTSYA